MCKISNEITEYYFSLLAVNLDDPLGRVAEAFDIEREAVEHLLIVDDQVETAR